MPGLHGSGKEGERREDGDAPKKKIGDARTGRWEALFLAVLHSCFTATSAATHAAEFESTPVDGKCQALFSYSHRSARV